MFNSHMKNAPAYEEICRFNAASSELLELLNSCDEMADFVRPDAMEVKCNE